MNFTPKGIRIRNSKIRIALSDLQLSAFTFAKGFESITQRFESPCFVLYNSSFRDSNRYVGDSNPCLVSLHVFHEGFESLNGQFESVALSIFSFFTWDSNRLIKDLNRSTSISLLEFGFESLHEGFKSPSSV